MAKKTGFEGKTLDHFTKDYGDVNALDIGLLFPGAKESKLAKQLERRYLNEFSNSIESVSDRNLLYYLIYLEVLQITRLQTLVNSFNTENESIPTQLLDLTYKNINQIITIKEKLGLTKSNKQIEANDAYQLLQQLKTKFAAWRAANQASRQILCPHDGCHKPIMLKIRTDAWTAQQHPFFEDRILGNRHLISLYLNHKITKEDVAAILKTSPDYVDWLISKWGIVKNQAGSGPTNASNLRQEAPGDTILGQVTP